MTKPAKPPAIKWAVFGKPQSGPPIGIKAAPPHLPDPIWRWPGESVPQMLQRAVWSAVGSGAVQVHLAYADDLPQSPGSGSSLIPGNGGSFGRVLGLFTESSKGVM